MTSTPLQEVGKEQDSNRRQRRAARALDRGFVKSCPRGYRFLAVPTSLYSRVRAQRDALELHDQCNHFSGRPHHYLAQAVEATASLRGSALTKKGRHINKRARDARHSWEVEDTGILKLCELLDEPMDLFQLHSRAFNQLYGGFDADVGNGLLHGIVDEVDNGEEEVTLRMEEHGPWSTSSGNTTEVDGLSDSCSDCRGESTELVRDFWEEEIDDIIEVFLRKAVEGSAASSCSLALNEDLDDQSLHVVSEKFDKFNSLHGGGDFVVHEGLVERDLHGLGVSSSAAAGASSLGASMFDDFLLDACGADVIDDYAENNLSKASVWADICSSGGDTSDDLDDGDELHVELDDKVVHDACQKQASTWRPVGTRWVKKSLELDFPALAEDSAQCEGDDGGHKDEDGDDVDFHPHELFETEKDDDSASCARGAESHFVERPQATEGVEALVPFYIPCESVAYCINRTLSKVYSRNALDLIYSASVMGAAFNNPVQNVVQARPTPWNGDLVDVAVSTDWCLPVQEHFEILDGKSQQVEVDEESQMEKRLLVERLSDVTQFFHLHTARANLQCDGILQVPAHLLVGNVLAELRKGYEEDQQKLANLQELNSRLALKISRLHGKEVAGAPAIDSQDSCMMHSLQVGELHGQLHDSEGHTGIIRPSPRGACCFEDVGGLSGNSGSSVPVVRSGNSRRTRKGKKVCKQLVQSVLTNGVTESDVSNAGTLLAHDMDVAMSQ